ncbi:hypothetical protein COOONC_04221 [Cooperia oncophora]
MNVKEYLTSLITNHVRSLSRGQLYDDEKPRKTVSHGHLPVLDLSRGGTQRSGDSTPVGEKSFTNGAFINSPTASRILDSQILFAEDDLIAPSDKQKDVKKSSSTTNLKSPHDFQHHILDDVLEETEEDMAQRTVRKKSTIEQYEERRTSQPPEQEEKKEETGQVVIPISEEPEETTKSGEFFIGQEENR